VARGGDDAVAGRRPLVARPAASARAAIASSTRPHISGSRSRVP